MKALRAVFVAVALIVMALPCALMPVLPSTLGAENRLPAEWPSLKTDDGKFNVNLPDEYEAWLQDHVALRNVWIGLHSRILRKLGTSSQEMVVLGKGDWLFYRDMLNDYTGAEPLTDDEVARMALTLDTVDNALKAQGRPGLTVAIIPNKGSIYPEQMLDAYPRRTTASTLERLQTKSHVRFVPMYEALSAQADQGLYFHGDVHWNGLGARIGASKILEALSEATGQKLPSPDPTDDYEIQVDWPGDLTRMLDPYSTECEPQQYYNDEHTFSYKKRPRSVEDLTINTKGKGRLRLLVLRDSFTNQLLEYIADASREATFLRAMPLPLKNGAAFDAVLLEMVERRLPELLAAPPDMYAMEAEAPASLSDAEKVDMRLEIDGDRLFGALEEAPSGIVEVTLGVRDAKGETWYSAFPISGVEDDGDNGFSALLEDIPADAEICVYMRGDREVCSDWTPVPEDEAASDGAKADEASDDGDAATNNLADLMKQAQKPADDSEDADEANADKDAATNNLADLMKQAQKPAEDSAKADEADADKDAATNNLADLMKQAQKPAEDSAEADEADADKDAATNNLADLMKQAQKPAGDGTEAGEADASEAEAPAGAPALDQLLQANKK